MTDASPPADPYRPADPAALAEIAALLDGARHATLAVLDAEGWPLAARIPLQRGEDGEPLALLSGLSMHSRLLSDDPRAALLIGDAGAAKGSPLARPRLSLQVRAERVGPENGAETALLRERWRLRDPRSAVYVGLPDFRFWRLRVRRGMLNGGFGRAVRFDAAQLQGNEKPPASSSPGV